MAETVYDDAGGLWVLGARSRREARTCAAAQRPTLRLVASTLRPLSRAQCAAHGHPDAHCLCWRRGEDRYRPCERDHPDAIAAWRIEPGAVVRCWRSVRALAARVLVRAPRPVLWGGRVARGATFLDRVLGHRDVVLGDRWLRPGMGEIRWCARCQRATSHSARRGRWFCAADDHASPGEGG